MAFYYFGPIYRNAILMAQYAEHHPDSVYARMGWETIHPHSIIRCGFCGVALTDSQVNIGFCDGLADLLGVPSNDKDVCMSNREQPQEYRDIPSTDGDSE